MNTTIPNSVYELRQIFDDPRYEGFGLSEEYSIDDKTEIYKAFSRNYYGREWSDPPRLVDAWRPVKVAGRVRAYNDYPCLGNTPAFSLRAVDALRDILEPNGELLPLESEIGQYFAYNVTTVIDALDEERSTVSRYDDVGENDGAIFSVDRYEFIPERLEGATIFQITSLPAGAYITPNFIKRVRAANLRGFDFRKLWPLPPELNYWQFHKLKKREREAAELPKGQTLKGQSLRIELRLNGSTPSEEDRKQIDRLADELDAMLVDVYSEKPAIGSLELVEYTAGEYEPDFNVCRLMLSCPDVNALVVKLMPWIKKLRWPAGFTVTKRYASFDNVAALEEEVDLSM